MKDIEERLRKLNPPKSSNENMRERLDRLNGRDVLIEEPEIEERFRKLTGKSRIDARESTWRDEEDTNRLLEMIGVRPSSKNQVDSWLSEIKAGVDEKSSSESIDDEECSDESLDEKAIEKIIKSSLMDAKYDL